MAKMESRHGNERCPFAIGRLQSDDCRNSVSTAGSPRTAAVLRLAGIRPPSEISTVEGIFGVLGGQSRGAPLSHNGSAPGADLAARSANRGRSASFALKCHYFSVEGGPSAAGSMFIAGLGVAAWRRRFIDLFPRSAIRFGPQSTTRQGLRLLQR